VAISLHAAIDRDREIAVPDAALIREYRAYSMGFQAAVLTAEQRTSLGSLVCHPLVDNVADLVLAAAAARLEFTGYAVDDDAVREYLATVVTKNWLRDIQFDVHYRALRDGNHYLGLQWVPERQVRTIPPPQDLPITVPGGAVTVPADVVEPAPGGRVQVHHEPAWDGEVGMFVGYDAAQIPTYAVKDFVQLVGDPPQPLKRRIVFFPDHLERYVGDGQGWRRFELPGEEGTNGVLPWVKRDGRPLGIPVVHYANPRFGEGPYGASDLAGGILGQQDALNSAAADLANAAQLTAFPMMKVRGIDPKSGAVAVGPGRVVGSAAADSDVAMMQPGDLSQLMAYYTHLLGVIARNTRTPLHTIGGGPWPSGEAIRRADGPAIVKALSLAKTVGPAWATLAHRSTEIGNAFGGLALDEDALVTAIFADPSQLDPLTQAQVAKTNAEMLATLSQVHDPTLLAKSGVVTDEEAAQIAGRETDRLAALPPVAAF
jgi:hypothetical protein